MAPTAASLRPDRVGPRVDVGAVGILVQEPGASYGPRTLHDHEFVWVIEGSLVWTSDGDTAGVSAGSVFLCPEGSTDHFAWDPRSRTTMGFFHFSLRGGARPGSWPRIRSLPDDDVIRPLFRHIAWLSESQPDGWRAQQSSAASLLLQAFIGGAVDTKPRTHADLPPAVERALRYVEDEWRGGRVRRVGLDELARAASVSARHLCRLFADSVGYGPTEALRLMRLQRAATLLAHTNMNVGAVAKATGFDNAFHFSRRFAEAYGTPPRSFRRQALQGEAIAPLPNVHRLTGRLWERT